VNIVAAIKAVFLWWFICRIWKSVINEYV